MKKIIKVEAPVLCIPVNNSREVLPMKIASSDGQFLNLNIAPCAPEEAEYIAEYALPFPFAQCELEAEECLLKNISWKPEQTLPVPVNGAVRPEFHFAPAKGWINDPNGLYFLDGKWHLFFQHNPFSANWNNMHWGHAESDDLIHWKETSLALYPDSWGTMFSGSAVVDHENCAGFGKEAVLLFYTNCSYTCGSGQCLAVKAGNSFVKYDKNPLIDCEFGNCDRDPNISYDSKAKVWRMALYLGNEEKREFALYQSDNLLNWEKTDSYYIHGGRECPGIRPMKDDLTGENYWLFTEANCNYRLGTVSADGKVAMKTEVKKFFYGDAYAGQFFHNAPDNRNIFIAWVVMPGGKFGSWSGGMSLPLETRLEDKTLKCRPAVDVPMTPFLAETKTVIPGKDRSIIFDPEYGIISDGERVWQVQKPGKPFRGKLLIDHAILEYFDDEEQYAAVFWFESAQ